MIRRTITAILVVVSILLTAPPVLRVHAEPTSDPGAFVDGIGNCTFGGLGCPWQLLTTSQGGDVVILAAWCLCSSAAPSVSDDAGLSYALRASFFAVQSPGPGFPLSLWEYYATTETDLSSDNITFVNQPGSYPDIFLQAFAIQKGDTESIFDPSSALPDIVKCPGVNPVHGGYGTCMASVGTFSNDFAFAITAINDASACPDPTSDGFTELATLGGHLDIDISVVGQSAQVSFTCKGGNAPGTDPMAMILDAVSLDGSQSTDTNYE